MGSAHRIDSSRLQPKAAKPRGRRRPDPLAEVWEPLLLPLLERHPTLTPTTLLEHLQEQKPDQDWSSLKRTLQRRVQHWKALHGAAPELMFLLAYQLGEIGFCDFTICCSTTAWLGGAAERPGRLRRGAQRAAHRSPLSRQPQPRRQLRPRHHLPLSGPLRPLRPFPQPQQPQCVPLCRLRAAHGAGAQDQHDRGAAGGPHQFTAN